MSLRPSIIAIVVGTTDISLIPGITVAGASPEMTHYTPALDVEYLIYGRPKTLDVIPVTPTGIPTPALITRAVAYDVPKLVVNAGSRIPPRCPYVELGGEPGRDFRRGPALSCRAVESIVERGTALGEELGMLGAVYIGESIPAGTTTAMAILVALGYDAWGRTSSASPQNPKELKVKVVREALERLGGRPPSDPIEAVCEMGDPVHMALAALARGVEKAGGTPVLAGGTQMAAAAALYKALGGNMDRLHVATTRWIAEDKNADFHGLMRAVGASNIHVASASFAESKRPGLRAYEEGAVKEGVAMGGALFYAQLIGRDVLQLVEAEYDRVAALARPQRPA
ncbi:MAG: nicotinate mononucleotide-dependent phosphoribosyltransferase CobT [Thermoproteus sp.]